MVSVLVRAAAILLTYGLMMLIPAARGDANIGLGLVWFAIVVIISACWGVLDGARITAAEVAIRWGLVALAVAIGSTIIGNSSHGAPDWSIVAGDLFFALPFMAFICLIPAVVGAAIGRRRDAR